MENTSDIKQDGFDVALGLTRDEIKIIESYNRLYTGTVIMGQYHIDVHKDLSTELELYYKECLEHSNDMSNPIHFKDWDDLSSIFNSEDKGSGIVVIFSHLNKTDKSMEERLENTNKDSQLFKVLKKLENTYLELKKIIESRDTIKDLLTEIFKNIPNYKEKQELIATLHENVLAESSKINQVFQDIKILNTKDLYEIDGDSPMVNYIQEIKCFE
ncbi:hypothetical protein [Candidatus Sulfurimonas baltica]|uniref:Uncharacterized protein n=1 Tax=Candidatus Sulfurimonas baltica TaxID=2740404 RepID=A0A7S7LU51_9BACT|nr:hypothetical protein [Candidatus Sulfurimonas baltica]QOY51350.1 hypothetical protein HUE88_09480 [Candidatus Sulfurimonas baltica]